MKAKKKTKQVNVISIEILNYVLDEIYKRLDKLEAVVDSLKYKDAEVIDLDKAEELDDSEKFTKEELIFLRNMTTRTPTKDAEVVHYLGGIYHKLSKMLKEKE